MIFRSFLCLFLAILFQANYLHACPLKSKSLGNILNNLLELEGKIKEVYDCGSNQLLTDANAKLVNVAERILTDYTNRKNKNNNDDDTIIDDSHLNNNDLEKGDLNEILYKLVSAMSNMAQVTENNKYRTSCLDSPAGIDYLGSALDLFNQVFPMLQTAAMASGNGAAIAIVKGVGAASSVSKAVVDSVQEQKSKYPMKNIANQKAFIEASCAYHELGTTIKILNGTLNSSDDLFAGRVKELREAKNKLLKKLPKLPLNIIQKSNQEIKNEVDKILAQADFVADDEIICNGMKHYLNRKILGVDKLHFLKEMYSLTHYYAKSTGDAVLSDYVYFAYMEKLQKTNSEILSEDDSRRRCQLEVFSDHFGNIQKLYDQQFEALDIDQQGKIEKEDMEDFNQYLKLAKKIRNIDLDIHIINNKLRFLKKVKDENISIEMGQILSIDQKLRNLLFKKSFLSKPISLNWMDHNIKKSQGYLKKFVTKKRRIDSLIKRNEKNTKKLCKELEAAQVDFYAASNFLNSNEVYCKYFWPFIDQYENRSLYQECFNQKVYIGLGGVHANDFQLAKMSLKRKQKSYETVMKHIKKNQCFVQYVNSDIDFVGKNVTKYLENVIWGHIPYSGGYDDCDIYPDTCGGYDPNPLLPPIGGGPLPDPIPFPFN